MRKRNSTTSKNTISSFPIINYDESFDGANNSPPSSPIDKPSNKMKIYEDLVGSDLTIHLRSDNPSNLIDSNYSTIDSALCIFQGINSTPNSNIYAEIEPLEFHGNDSSSQTVVDVEKELKPPVYAQIDKTKKLKKQLDDADDDPTTKNCPS